MGYCIKNLHKLAKLSPSSSPEVRICLRSCIKLLCWISFQTPRPPNFQTWKCDLTLNKTRVEEWLEKAEEPTFKYPLMVFCTYSKEAYCLRRAGRFFMSFNRLSSAWRIWFENMKLWKSDRVCNLGLVTKESVSSYLSVMFPPSWAELRAMVSPSVHPASPRSLPVQPTLPSNPGAPHVQLGRVHHWQPKCL